MDIKVRIRRDGQPAAFSSIERCLFCHHQHDGRSSLNRLKREVSSTRHTHMSGEGCRHFKDRFWWAMTYPRNGEMHDVLTQTDALISASSPKLVALFDG